MTCRVEENKSCNTEPELFMADRGRQMAFSNKCLILFCFLRSQRKNDKSYIQVVNMFPPGERRETVTCNFKLPLLTGDDLSENYFSNT